MGGEGAGFGREEVEGLGGGIWEEVCLPFTFLMMILFTKVD